LLPNECLLLLLLLLLFISLSTQSGNFWIHPPIDETYEKLSIMNKINISHGNETLKKFNRK